jgi:hypothetical protein
MTVLKSAGIVLATAAAFVVASAPVAAKPAHHRSHKVCKIEHFHGHAKKVCRWVR